MTPHEHADIATEAIESGIPPGFTDPHMSDYKSDPQNKASPGFVCHAKAKPGEKTGDALHESARAALPQEVPAFVNRLKGI